MEIIYCLNSFISGDNFNFKFFTRVFLYKSYVLAAFSSQKSIFVHKKRAENVDEIDARAQCKQDDLLLQVGNFLMELLMFVEKTTTSD